MTPAGPGDAVTARAVPLQRRGMAVPTRSRRRSTCARPSTRSAQDVLAGGSLREALRELMRRGMDGRRGLDDLADRVRRLREAARRRGDLGGTLDQVRAMLDQALAEERDTLAGEDGDDARLAEMELATIPDDVAGAVRALGGLRLALARGARDVRADPADAPA